MGFNSENGRKICFDIETAPLPDAAQYLIEPVEAPSNYKDPIKIANYVAEKKASQIGDCSFDPDLCQVVCVGLCSESRYPATMTMHLGLSSEADMLTWFWHEAEQGHLVGFRCGAFDLPVLLRRSLYLGVKAPPIHIDKYRHPDYTDLMTLLSYNGVLPWHSLDFYAKRFGLDLTDIIDGSGVAKAVAEGAWEYIEQHCANDVRRTAFVAEKCGYFRPVAAQVF